MSLSSIYLSHKLAADDKNSLLIEAMTVMASLVYLTSIYILMLVKRYTVWYLPPGAKKTPTNYANTNHDLPFPSQVFSD